MVAAMRGGMNRKFARSVIAIATAVAVNLAYVRLPHVAHARDDRDRSRVEWRPGGSTEVGLAFPTDPSQVTVGPDGDAVFHLDIPGFPAALQPQLRAAYSRRVGDGPLGMGWEISVPNIRDDVSEGAAIEPLDSYTHTGSDGKSWASGRWQANPGGKLVCSGDRAKDTLANAFVTMTCWRNPRTPHKYERMSELGNEWWRTLDPLDGVTTNYGATPASRIDDEGRVVAWFIHSQTNMYGHEVRHFYEQRKGSNERLRVGIVVGGDKLIRFRYRKRTENIVDSYRLTAGATSEHLLDQIELHTGCGDVEQKWADDDVWTTFGACDDAKPLERVALGYSLQDTYSNRYLLTSWQHMSGDGLVSYRPVTFEYSAQDTPVRGDGVTTNNYVDVPDAPVPDDPSIVVPAGYDLLTEGSDAGLPTQTYFDFNRDGLQDWVHAKWDPDAGEHTIEVRYRNAARGFDPPITYTDPISEHAQKVIWDWSASAFAPEDGTDQLGIVTNGYLPGMGLSVATSCPTPQQTCDGCLPWPGDAQHFWEPYCDALRSTYERLWEPEPDEYAPEADDFGFKVIELSDWDGDGYADRVVSGMLVTYDPGADDADSGGWRSPATMDPSVYVSRFDPDIGPNGGFLPFARYNVASPGAAYPDLEGAGVFLSALGIELDHNHQVREAPTPGRLSDRAAVRGGLSLVSQAYGFAQATEGVVSSFRTPGGDPTRDVAGLALDVVNLAVTLAGFDPSASVPEGLGAFLTATSYAFTAMRLADKLSYALQSSSAGGWFSFTGAVVQVGSMLHQQIIQWVATSQMNSPQYSSASVYKRSRIAATVVKIIALHVSTGLQIAALVSAATVNVAGIVIAVVLFAISLVIIIIDASAPDGKLYFTNGVYVPYEIQHGEGIVYQAPRISRGIYLETDYRALDKREVLLQWTDITGNARPDLVIARHSPGEAAGMGVFPGNTDEGADPDDLWTLPFRPWSFRGEEPDAPVDLGASTTDYTLITGTTHKVDLTETGSAMLDINADGRIDYVRSRGGKTPGYDVWLNTGTAFASVAEWDIDAASYPSDCTGAPTLSASRSIAWTYIGTDDETEYAFSLSNSVQQLGLDVDGNGLPDLVYKDETSYPGMSGWVEHESFTADGWNRVCGNAWPAPTDDILEASSWYAHLSGGHLSFIARELFSPQQEGTHYVAFNTGSGFTPFVALEQDLPSLGGAIHAVDVAPDTGRPRETLVTGQSNAVMDPDGDGSLYLVSMEIDDTGYVVPSSFEVASTHKLGVRMPDVLTHVHFPEGGTVALHYDVVKDPQGRQGPPIAVVSEMVFDDAVRAPMAAQDGLTDVKPFVRYHYADAQLDGREFLGFEYIAEERYSGTEYTQVAVRHDMAGYDRGFVDCIETRGTTVTDGTVVPLAGGVGVTATCRGKGDGKPSAGYASKTDREYDKEEKYDKYDKEEKYDKDDKDDKDGTSHARACVPARTFGPSYVPLPVQRVVDNGWKVDHTITHTRPDSSTVDLLRDADLWHVNEHLFNGTGRQSWVTTVIGYNAPPYKTPTVSHVTASNAAPRTLTTEWVHRDDEWFFFKKSQSKLDSASATVLSTEYVRDGSAPFHLRQIVERSGAEVRRQTFDAYGPSGRPGVVAQGPVKNHFAYDPQTGLVVRKMVAADAFVSASAPWLYDYDDLGRLVRMTNPNGGTSKIKRDGLGLAEVEYRPQESAQLYTYDDIGTVTVGRSSTALSASQRTMATRKVDGQIEQHVTYWDGFHRPFRTAVAVGGKRMLELDFDGDGTADGPSVWDDDAQWFDDRDAKYLVTDMRVDAVARTQCTSLAYLDGTSPAAWSSRGYDALGRPTLARDFEGATTVASYGIDGSGWAFDETVDPLGTKRRRTRDAHYRVVRDDYAGLVVTETRHADWDGVVRVADSRGVARIVERNGWQQPTAECVRADLSASLPAGDVCPTGYPDEWPTTKISYDAAGLSSRVEDPAGNVTAIRNNACGEVGVVRHPSARASSAGYTSTEVHRYNGACQAYASRERNGSLTVREFDSAGRVTGERMAAGWPEQRKLEYGYDGVGRALWSADGRGYRSYVVHDFRGNPIHTVDPSGVQSSVSYDVHGFVASSVDAAGLAVDYDTDRMGRRTAAKWEAEVCSGSGAAASMQTLETSTLYDAVGNLTDHWYPDKHTVHYEYDALHRRKREYAAKLTSPGDDYDPAVYRAWSYDDSGNVDTERDFEGNVVTYGYDGRNLPTSVLAHADASTPVKWRYEYDERGQLERELSPNSVSGSTCAVGTGGVAAFTTDYVYTPMGQLEEVHSPHDSSGTRYVSTYLHDRSGNMVRELDQRGVGTDHWYDRLHRHRTTTLSDGNLLEYEYDADGRLIEAVDPRGVTTSHAYDVAGRRWRRSSPDGERRWGHDGAGRVVLDMALADGVRWEGTLLAHTADSRVSTTRAAAYYGSDPTVAASVVLAESTTCHDAARREGARKDAEGSV